MSDPTLAFLEVNLVSSKIKAVYSVTERADEVELRVKTAYGDSFFSLATRGFSESIAALALTGLVSHAVVRVRDQASRVTRGLPLVSKPETC